MVAVSVWYFVVKYKKSLEPKEPSREEMIRRQLEELNAMEAPKLDEEEIQEQLNDLNTESQPEQPKPLSEEEIQKQLEELNKLQPK